MILRSAFWLGVLVMLLPSDERQQQWLIETASAKVHWAMTFCDRNPETCVKASEQWQHFLKKAEFGVALAGQLVHSWGEKEPEPQKPMVVEE